MPLRQKDKEKQVVDTRHACPGDSSDSEVCCRVYESGVGVPALLQSRLAREEVQKRVEGLGVSLDRKREGCCLFSISGLLLAKNNVKGEDEEGTASV